MKMSNVSAGRFLIDRGTDAKRASRTSWREESYIKVSSTLSNSTYSILDYRAPAGFGVVRHLHHREDEVLHLVEGQIAVWMPDRCLTMTPGDLVFLPKEVEHADGTVRAQHRCRAPSALDLQGCRSKYVCRWRHWTAIQFQRGRDLLCPNRVAGRGKATAMET
jgi:mannose-6-phosphate isomerase-like protein (cupin superfamily)